MPSGAHGVKTERNFGRADVFLQRLKHLLLVAAQFGGSVDDDLRRVGLLQLERAHVVDLAIGDGRGRVGILPAVVVPVIHVLTQHDELGAGDRLRFVPLLHQSVRGRTAGTAFRGKQLQKNRRADMLLHIGDLAASRHDGEHQQNAGDSRQLIPQASLRLSCAKPCDAKHTFLPEVFLIS